MFVSIDELINNCKKVYSTCKTPVVILDSTFRCVWSNDPLVFSEGENLLNFVREPISNPLHDHTDAHIFKNEHFYCGRLIPIENELNEPQIYICELIDSEAVLKLAEKTDIASSLLPINSALEYNMAGMWQNAEALRSRLMQAEAYDDLAKVLELETKLANISSVTKNAFEYIGMIHDEAKAVRIDAAALARNLVKRCNAALAKCGRHIELLTEPDDLMIYADSRRTVVALANALQNALLYSPRESVPLITVYKREIGNHRFVDFKIVNENIMFTCEDFKDNVDVNFSFQRIGFGIPIIQRFAKLSGGSFDMQKRDGKVIVTVSLPYAPPYEGYEQHFENSEMGTYKTGIPDFVDIRMREVVQFFGEIQE